MARIRTIKPEFFLSPTIGDLSYRCRLTFIGLWTYVDDEGRARLEPRVIAGQLWPLDDDVNGPEVLDDILTLNVVGLVRIYTVDVTRYLAVTGWSEHQRINRKTPSRIPPPPLTEPSLSTRGNPQGYAPEFAGYGDNPVDNSLTESSLSPHDRKGKERKGKEGKGDADIPSPFCPLHPHGTTEPCRACGNARREYADWILREARRPTPVPELPPSPDECDHPKFLAGHCVFCGIARTEVA